MKCASLWQPWATLMEIGAKANETRGWPTKHRGPLLIHAAKYWNRELEALCFTPPFLKALRPNPGGANDLMIDRILRARGKILCVANVVDCVQITVENTPAGAERYFGDYTPSRFMWRTDRVHAFEEPIPFVGHQGLFNVPDELVAAQLPAWARSAA